MSTPTAGVGSNSLFFYKTDLSRGHLEPGKRPVLGLLLLSLSLFCGKKDPPGPEGPEGESSEGRITR